MALTDQLAALRQENREDHMEIQRRLDRINGTVREHERLIATMLEVQNGHNKTLDRIEESLKGAWKRIRALDMTVLRHGVVIGIAVTATIVLLQYVVVPLVKHVLNGG